MTDYKDRVSGWATDIDWSKAPEGATHWGPENSAYVESWYKKCDGKWMYATYSSRWQWGYLVFGIKHEREIELIPRPAPQWNGEGLPPVGTRLECQYAVEGFTTWHAGECIAVGTSPEGEVICVIKAGETIACYRAGSRMRPIKTPAQIAAEERHDAINKMVAIFPLVASEHEIAAALYDAGLRFPKGDDQ